MHKITLAELRGTKPLTQWERNYLGNKMNRDLRAHRGKRAPFRLKVGDRVMDTTTQERHTVTELYYENGHNKIASETRFHREQDLMVIG